MVIGFIMLLQLEINKWYILRQFYSEKKYERNEYNNLIQNFGRKT